MVPHDNHTPRHTILQRAQALALPAVFWSLLLAFTVITLYNALYLEGRFTPDSLFYVDAARNMLTGQGFSQSMIELHRVIHTDSVPPVPQTTWAPLYPIAIALTAFLFPISEPAAALAVSALGAAGLAILVYILIARLYSIPAAVLAATQAILLFPIHWISRNAWSETLGVCWMLLALHLLVTSKTTPRDWRPWAAGLAAGLAVATRFALLPLGALGAAWYLLRPGNPPRLYPAFACGIAFALLTAPIFLRNLYHAGKLGGSAGDTSTILEGLHHTTLALALSGGSMSFGLPILYLIILTWLAVILFRNPYPTLESLREGLLTNQRYLIPAWALLYLAFLIYAQTRVHTDPIDVRLALPAAIVFFPYLLAAVVHAAHIPRTLACAMGCAALIIAIVPQLNTARSIATVGPRLVHDFTKRVENSPTLHWLDQHVTARDLLIVEEGLDVSFTLGRPVPILFFSAKRWPEHPLDWPSLSAYLHRVNACERFEQIYIVLERKEGDREELTELYGAFNIHLQEVRLDPYPSLSLAAGLEAGVIIAIDCDTFDP